MREPSDVHASRSVWLGVGVALIVGLVLSTAGRVVGGLPVLLVAVAIGAVTGAVLDRHHAASAERLSPGWAVTAKRVMRIGVVLLGLRLGLGDLADLGPTALAVVAATVMATFFGTQWVGRRLGVERDTALLVATGYSICGVSAIAGMAPNTKARSDQVATAVALVTLFGTLSMFVLPTIATAVGLSSHDAGAWIGAATHDVAQVVAAAASLDDDAVNTAVVVKLARVVLLAPLVAGVAWWRRKERLTDPQRNADAQNSAADNGAGHASRPAPVPLFVVGFISAMLLRTSGLLPEVVIDGARVVEGIAFTAAMFAIGTSVRWSTLRSPGPAPFVLGTVAWVLVGSVALAGVLAI